MPDEKLLKTETTVRAVVYMLVAAIVILLANAMYTIATRGFSALNVIPVAFLPIVILNVVNLKELQKEIKARGLKSR
jgi:hypothetical protein